MIQAGRKQGNYRIKNGIITTKQFQFVYLYELKAESQRDIEDCSTGVEHARRDLAAAAALATYRS